MLDLSAEYFAGIDHGEYWSAAVFFGSPTKVPVTLPAIYTRCQLFENLQYILSVENFWPRDRCQQSSRPIFFPVIFLFFSRISGACSPLRLIGARALTGAGPVNASRNLAITDSSGHEGCYNGLAQNYILPNSCTQVRTPFSSATSPELCQNGAKIRQKFYFWDLKPCGIDRSLRVLSIGERIFKNGSVLRKLWQFKVCNQFWMLIHWAMFSKLAIKHFFIYAHENLFNKDPFFFL